MNIKSEKGVTLTSLIIYVIAMVITVTIITVVTAYFKKNVSTDTESYTFLSEFTKFQSYFTEEVNRENNRILEVKKGEGTEQTFVAFSSGNQYTFVPNNSAIYQNNVKITSGVKNCVFTQGEKNGKQSIKVSITIQGKSDKDPQVRTTEYVLQD